MTGANGGETCVECHEPVAEEHDFCPNGHYAAWWTLEREAGRDTAPEQTPAVPAAAPPSQPEFAAALEVSLPDAPPPPPGEVLHVVTRAGGVVQLVATLRNAGRRVDDYAVHVTGLPTGWATFTVGEAHLMPKDHGGQSRARVAFEVLPPLAPSSAAGVWSFRVDVTSVGARGALLASCDCAIEVLPFSAVVVAARPAIASGRRGVAFVCEVRNNGNRAIVPVLSAIDADGACTMLMPASIEKIPPGSTRAYRVGVRAPRRLIIGRPLDRVVTIGVLVDGLDVPPPPQIVTFRQRPILPWWLIPLLTLLLAIAAFVYTQWPRKVTTPSLKGAKSAFVAQGLLQQAGFRKPPVVHTRVLPRPAPGTVYDQRPRPGKRVDADTVVTIRVAVPPTITIIPDLAGMSAARADAVLFRDHLALGNIVPSPKSKNPIASQIPRAGSVKPRNTVVNVVLADAPPGRVPNVTCLTPGSAEKRLNAKGFELAVVPTTVSPSAHARGQIPLPGSRRKPGAQITLQFSGPPPTCPGGRKLGAGSSNASAPTGARRGAGVGSILAPAPAGSAGPAPRGIAYAVDGDVRVTGAASVRVSGEQPAWSRSGSAMAVSHDGQITVTRPARSGAAFATIAIAGRRLATPAFGSVRGTPVLAFVATSLDAGEQLCFARVTGTREPASSCRDIGDVEPLSLAWSPDGRELLLAANISQDPYGPGLLRFTSPRGASAAAASWRPQQTADEDGLHPARRATLGAVLDAAFLPGGRRIALITNLRPNGRLGVPQVVLTQLAQIRDLDGARWLRVPGCSVAVGPGGAQLAVGSPNAQSRCDGTGALMFVAVDQPRARSVLAEQGTDPAWRP